MINWLNKQRLRGLLAASLGLLALALLYAARKALLPFALGALLAYLAAPLVNWIHSHLPLPVRARRASRGVVILLVYLLALASLFSSLAFVIPPIGAELNLLVQRLPELAQKVYSVAPETIQIWLERYNQVIPEDIRLAIQRQVESWIPSLLSLLQTGASKTIGIVFSTLSFVLGLLVVPLWMFYVLRDHSEMSSSFESFVPAAYREDVHNILVLVDSVVGAYLRGQFILCLSVGILFTIGLLILDIDFALLLGAIAGAFEIIPVLGPVLGAIPAILVTLATSPSQLLWVILLAFAVQQFENAFLVPQVTGITVRIHPALVMLVLVIGSEIAGVAGVILSVPLTAAVRDIVNYLRLRLADEPLSPQEALAHVGNTYRK